ncbi:hypothetical protein ABMA10_19315 [Plantibacter sp. RU18]
MESMSQVLKCWAGRISRFNAGPMEVLVILGGAVGRGFSILAGTAVLWFCAPFLLCGLSPHVRTREVV